MPSDRQSTDAHPRVRNPNICGACLRGPIRPPLKHLCTACAYQGMLANRRAAQLTEEAFRTERRGER